MKSLAVKALALIAILAMTSPAFSQHKPYIIGIGDVLSVAIFAGGTTQESLDLEVSSKGTISFPFLGEIKVEGLSVTQLTETVARPRSSASKTKKARKPTSPITRSMCSVKSAALVFTIFGRALLPWTLVSWRAVLPNTLRQIGPLSLAERRQGNRR
jgi:hypothetical protein